MSASGLGRDWLPAVARRVCRVRGAGCGCGVGDAPHPWALPAVFSRTTPGRRSTPGGDTAPSGPRGAPWEQQPGRRALDPRPAGRQETRPARRGLPRGLGRRQHLSGVCAPAGSSLRHPGVESRALPRTPRRFPLRASCVGPRAVSHHR